MPAPLEALIEQQTQQLREAEEWCGQAEATKNKLGADTSKKDLQLSTLESRCQRLSAEGLSRRTAPPRSYNRTRHWHSVTSSRTRITTQVKFSTIYLLRSGQNGQNLFCVVKKNVFIDFNSFQSQSLPF